LYHECFHASRCPIERIFSGLEVNDACIYKEKLPWLITAKRMFMEKYFGFYEGIATG